MHCGTSRLGSQRPVGGHQTHETLAQLIPNSDTPCTCTASSRVELTLISARFVISVLLKPLCYAKPFHHSTHNWCLSSIDRRRDMDHELELTNRHSHSSARRETSSLTGNGPDSDAGSEADVESLASLRKQKDTATEFKGRHIQMMALGTISSSVCRG